MHNARITFADLYMQRTSNLSEWRKDARSGSIDLHKLESEIQVNVTINSNLLLDRAPFYHIYSGLRK